VLLSSAALERWPFAIECKNQARIAVYRFYEQAVDNAGAGLIPIVVIKENRSEPLVLISLENFIASFSRNRNP
jgi:hypothetical protein